MILRGENRALDRVEAFGQLVQRVELRQVEDERFLVAVVAVQADKLTHGERLADARLAKDGDGQRLAPVLVAQIVPDNPAAVRVLLDLVVVDELDVAKLRIGALDLADRRYAGRRRLRRPAQGLL